MTPDEAKRTRCYRNLEDFCWAEKCMAWRWRRAKETKGYLEKVQNHMVEHKATFAAASSEVFKNAELFEETEGYCGLAGKPE